MISLHHARCVTEHWKCFLSATILRLQDRELERHALRASRDGQVVDEF